MLTVSGLIVIPADHQLKEYETTSGVYLDFTAISQDKNWQGEPTYHRYHVNMWVPKEEVEKWKGRIKHLEVFLIKTAQWSAESKSEDKGPMNLLKVDVKNLRHLATPKWYDKEDNG